MPNVASLMAASEVEVDVDVDVDVDVEKELFWCCRNRDSTGAVDNASIDTDINIDAAVVIVITSRADERMEGFIIIWYVLYCIFNWSMFVSLDCTARGC
jgi:hypothetical protein